MTRRIRIRYFGIAMTTVAATALVIALSWWLVQSTDSEPITPAENVSSAEGLYVPLSVFPGAPPRDEAARRATLIVDATVTGFGTPFWNTPDGARPEGTNREILAQRDYIFTPVSFEVSRVLKGELPSDTPLSLSRLGGRIGNDEFVIEDGDYFQKGDRIILFVADCDEARSAERVARGFRYSFVQRHVIDEEGMATGVIDGPPIPLQDLLNVINAEKNNSPISPANC